MAKPDQRTDDENSAASDPNMSGPQQTQAVRDKNLVGMMTPTCEYGEHLDHVKGSLYGK